MKESVRLALALTASAGLLACHVDQLLHPGGPGAPPDSVPARVAFTTAPSHATAGLPLAPPVQVAVLDSVGQPLTTYSGTVTLGLAVNPGGGALTGTATVAASHGVATFSSVSINTPGSGYVLSASTPGAAVANSDPIDVGMASAPPATHLAFISQPVTTRAGDPISPAIQVAAEDSTGAVVPTYTGTITLAIGANPGQGTLAGTRALAAQNGVASFSSLSIDQAGSGYTLIASAPNLSGGTSAAFDITPGPPPPPPPAVALRFVVQPQTVQAGATMGPVEVAAVDSTGARATAFSGSITVVIGANPSGATLSGTATVTADSGLATFSGLSLNRAGSGYTLVATASGLTGVASQAFDVTAVPPPPPTATALRFTSQPQSAQTGGSLGTIAVAAVDSTGTTVASFAGSITLAIGANPGGGTLSGTASAPASSGVATFSGLSIDKAGSGYTLVATANGLTGATSQTFAVTAPPPPPPTIGSLGVTTTTTGSNLDPDGYTVQVDGGPSKAIGDNGSVTFDSLSASTHTVVLSGLATNCSAGGGSSQTATVPAGGSASVAFAVTCQAPPPPTTGNLTVTTTTTGSDLDPDGFTATVDGGTSHAVGDNASVTFSNLSAGDHTVVLSGLASNCAVGSSSQTVTVPAGGSASASYAVTCQAIPTTGSLTVSTATSGSDQDADGYTVSVDGGGSQSIRDNASVTFSSLSAGSHTVTLSGLASNCTVGGGTSQTVTVPAGGSTSTSFAVTCTAPPPTTGSLTVSATTTGADLDPDGYGVSVDGGTAQAISDNGSVTFSDLASGSHTLAITGVASNCSASSTSQSVTVPAGGSTSASFAITCVAPPPTNHPPVVNAGGNQSAVEAVLYQLNASFTDVDGDGPWAYNVNWGDGTSSSGTLSAQGAIGPTHTYLLPNDYTITVTVTDAHGASGTDSKILHVTL